MVAGSALGNSVAAALVPGHGRPPLYIVTRASGSAKAESSCCRGPRLRRPDWQIGRRLFDIIDPESTRIVRLLPEVTDSYRFVAQQKTGICREVEGRGPRIRWSWVPAARPTPEAIFQDRQRKRGREPLRDRLIRPMLSGSTGRSLSTVRPAGVRAGPASSAGRSDRKPISAEMCTDSSQTV